MSKKYLNTLEENSLIEIDNNQITLGPGTYNITYTDSYGVYQTTIITKLPPKYQSSPLWKAINGKTEKNTKLSQGRLRESEGHNSETKESSEKATENNRITKE